MCAVDDADMWTLHFTEQRKARKDYACDDCRRTIERGEKYHYSTGMIDGYWSTFHVCAHCHAAGWWLVEVCGGWLYEMIGDELRDHWYEGYESLVLGRLIVGHRRKWRRWDGTLMPVPTPWRINWALSAAGYKHHVLGYERLDVAS